jgi:AICAR transformylase/IMP cyclohydrolase PurH
VRAVKADPISAFGGIVAFTRVVDEKLAKEIHEIRCGFVGKDQHRCVSMMHTV